MPTNPTPSPQPPWLRGPIPGIPALLQPVAHALVDADEDAQKALANMTGAQLNQRPVRVSRIAARLDGFHELLHAAFAISKRASLLGVRWFTRAAIRISLLRSAPS